MVQYALPDANASTTNWSQRFGDDDADWYDELDEGFGAGRGSGSGPDNNTTSWDGPNNPSQEIIRTALASVTDPASSSGHIFRTRNAKTNSGGRQIDVVIRLLESGTIRASQPFTNIGTTYTNRTDTLTSGEADAITDYTVLEIETEASVVGGGPGRTAAETTHEFECPDAPVGGGFAHSQGVIVG